MDLLKDIILQLSFIIFPIMSYHVFWLSNDHSHVLRPNKGIITISASISSLLCICFPIETVDGAFFNLQAIPLFISFTYAGYISGLITLSTSIMYLIHPLELHWIYYFLFLLLCSLLSCAFTRRWHRKNKKGKLLASSLYGVSILILTYIGYSIADLLELLPITLLDYAILGISVGILMLTLYVAIYLIEYMKENSMYRKEILKTEKLKIVSELAASVAHEVRNPLTVVRGFIQLMGYSKELPPDKKKEYADLVMTEIDRAQSIITDYLSLAGQQYLTKERIPLTLLLNDLSTLMSSYANLKSVKFVCHTDEHLFVHGDKTKLKQVFINVIKNSIEAVPDLGGVVTIGAEAKDEMIQIKISDNGAGMSHEQLARLGEPYYTLKERGTGLGLTVTYSILKNHNGHIHYKSELHKGTIATITLPCYLGDEPFTETTTKQNGSALVTPDKQKTI
ncbi:ATP-binding protein [Metabacillus sp. HB246100]